jgi:hypothetical protein
VSVLLRQPHGFEGLRLAHVDLPMDDQPVPERVDMRVLPQRQLDPGGATAHPLVKEHDDAVPGIHQLILKLDGLPGAEPLSPEPAHGHGPVVDATDARYLKFGGVPFDIGMQEASAEVSVTSNEGFEGRAYALHVLLRHRPRSIPQCQEESA